MTPDYKSDKITAAMDTGLVRRQQHQRHVPVIELDPVTPYGMDRALQTAYKRSPHAGRAQASPGRRVTARALHQAFKASRDQS